MCCACCAVYDVTQRDSLDNLSTKWMRDFKEYGRPDAVQMVVGNKIDLVRVVIVQGGLPLSMTFVHGTCDAMCVVHVMVYAMQGWEVLA